MSKEGLGLSQAELVNTYEALRQINPRDFKQGMRRAINDGRLDNVAFVEENAALLLTISKITNEISVDTFCEESFWENPIEHDDWPAIKLTKGEMESIRGGAINGCMVGPLLSASYNIGMIVYNNFKD